jgi:hypothetical protein
MKIFVSFHASLFAADYRFFKFPTVSSVSPNLTYLFAICVNMYNHTKFIIISKNNMNELNLLTLSKP